MGLPDVRGLKKKWRGEKILNPKRVSIKEEKKHKLRSFKAYELGRQEGREELREEIKKLLGIPLEALDQGLFGDPYEDDYI